MSGRYEQEKRRIEESGSPLVKHSRNQHKIKSGIEGDIRVSRTLFFSDDKASRARRKRMERQEMAIDECHNGELEERVRERIIFQLERVLEHSSVFKRITVEEFVFFVGNRHLHPDPIVKQAYIASPRLQR